MKKTYTIMLSCLLSAIILTVGYNAGRNEGIVTGRNEGITSGRNEGYEAGFTAGKNEGFISGREDAIYSAFVMEYNEESYIIAFGDEAHLYTTK